MKQEKAVLEIINRALGAVNEERGETRAIPIAADTTLFGTDALLDSLELVSVIVDVETEVNRTFEVVLSLTDDRAMSMDPVPFANVQSLKSYILELLAERT